MPRDRSLPSWVLVTILAVVYFVAAKLGLELARLHPSATAIWPPTGIALAALLLWGSRLWPAVFIGAFLANITTAGSFSTSLGIAAGNTFEALVGAYLVERFCGGIKAFDRPQEIFKFTFFAAILSTIISATVGVTSLFLGGYAGRSDLGEIWATWWLGDAAGAIVVAPLLILWKRNPKIEWDRRKIFEAVLLLAFFLAATQLIFGDWFPEAYNRLPFLYIPILVWAAFRFGQRETATAAFLIASAAIWGTLMGSGPFVLRSQNVSFVLLGAFMSTVTVTAMVLAAGVSELKRAETALRSRLEQQAEVARFGLLALAEADLPTLMNETVSLIARTLEVEYASVLKFLPDKNALLLEVGTGWEKGYVGREMVSAGTDSPGGYTLLSGEPVIIEDFRAETRFKVPLILRDHNVVSGVTVIIQGGEGPYGILGAQTTQRRSFSLDDIHFLQAMANVLANAIRRQRSDEQLRQYAGEVESFSYTVAQELRSPLWSIIGLSQTLSKDFAGKMDLRRLESVQRIADYAEHMGRLIQGLLAYGKFGRVDPRLETWNLGSLVPEALNQLTDKIRQSGAEVDFRQPFSEVLADRATLVQVLVNVFSNAIKFVKPGTAPRIGVWSEDRGQFVRLTVEDNGIGIPPEYHKRIFRIFERLSGPGRDPGTGIGLAIVARGVAWMGGRTGVESEVGKGSRFWIELPKP